MNKKLATQKKYKMGFELLKFLVLNNNIKLSKSIWNTEEISKKLNVTPGELALLIIEIEEERIIIQNEKQIKKINRLKSRFNLE